MASVYSVAQISRYIKNMFSQDFMLNHIFVKGEVSNCKYNSSGHIFFTLKDAGGVIQGVMFAGQRKGLSFQLTEGQEVIVEGRVSIYERDGRYQLYASSITLDGKGDLYKQFEELRDRLSEMGMFEAEYKQPIPAYGSRIGIVTASTGAAIQDIMNISYRRNPYVSLFLYPAKVQGEGAGKTIVAGIRKLDEMDLDCIIIGRGGGSIEDLWAFNEEEVARAIFACKTPLISAVGHETDWTIADFVADLRAPTPSAAAELAVFDLRSLTERLSALEEGLKARMAVKVEALRNRLANQSLKLKVYSPKHQLLTKRQQVAELEDRMGHLMGRRLMETRHRLSITAERLNGLSPLAKISHGYGYIADEQDFPIKSVGDVKCGQPIKISLQDGVIYSQVTKTELQDGRK